MPLCLVTGATGLIGSHLMPALTKEGWQVFCFSRRPVAGLNVHTIDADLQNPLDETLLPSKVDAVIHLVQSEHYRDLPSHADALFQVNTASTYRLLQYAKKAGAKRFILASSGAVYGWSDDAFCESDPCSNRLDFYAASRRASELLTQMFADDIEVIILRFFFVYGPGQKSTMLIPRLIQSVQNGTPVKLQGEDGLRLNPVHVDDAVPAVMAGLAHDQSDVFNIAGSEVLTLRDIAETIGQVFGRPPVFETADTKQPRHLVGDIQKMSQHLAAPGVTFSQGIETMVEPARILA